MKLYDGGRAPNPRRVRIFLAEKGIEVPLEPVDMGSLAHLSPEMTSRNPLQHLPILELDDGTIITETVAICRYFEEVHPNPALFGQGAVGKAQVEMWSRRIELYLFLPVAAAFRHLHPAMKEREVPQVPEWGEANKLKATAFLELMDKELATREFASGDAFSIADITALVALDFMKVARITVPDHLSNVLRWKTQLSARSSSLA